MKKNVIVSLADSNYFGLLNELIDSIKSFEKSKGSEVIPWISLRSSSWAFNYI